MSKQLQQQGIIATNNLSRKQAQQEAINKTTENNKNFQTTIANNEHHEKQTSASNIQIATRKNSSSGKQVEYEADSKTIHRTLEIRLQVE
jgi:hypothetical protein